MSATTVKTGNAGRLATIRRLYFYLIAFVSLTTGLLALHNLLTTLFDIWLTATTTAMANDADFVRNSVARDSGLLLVATPIFVIHWAYVQAISRRAGADADEERTSTLRKLFLYAASALTMTLSAVRLYRLVSESVSVLTGDGRLDALIWPAGWLSLVASVLIHLLTLSYFLQQLRLDADLGSELRWAGTLRRIFQTVTGLVGLGILLSGGGAILEQGLRLLLENLSRSAILQSSVGWWRVGVADGSAGLLVGALLWWINWRRWDALIQRNDAEARTALRRFYLYGATILSAACTLAPSALLLYRLLLQLFGVAEPAALPDLAGPLSLAPLGLIAWRWHWQEVNREAMRYGDSPESANVRRLYYYLVAAVGLVLMWLGLVEMLRALLDWLIIGGAAAAVNFRAEQLARGISFVAVGAPVWSIHWQAVQRVARGDDHAAQSERTSGPRRAYLYAVALVGALLILFDLALVLYRVLLWALGDANADVFGAETLDSLVRSGSAAVFWIVHVLAIRTDTRLTESATPTPEDIGERRATLLARIDHLETELSEARAALAVLDKASTQQRE
ncbi:MAG: DUF5671 domain-containing protein [Caldilineaceae bacterium]